MVNLQGNDLQAKFNIARIIYMVIMATIVVYVYIVILVNKGTGPGYNHIFPPNLVIFKYILYVISFIMFFILNFIRQIILSGKSQSNGAAPASDGSKFLIVTIVADALCEAVLIYGFVLFLVGRQIKDFLFPGIHVSNLFFVLLSEVFAMGGMGKAIPDCDQSIRMGLVATH